MGLFLDAEIDEDDDDLGEKSVAMMTRMMNSQW